jgi:23S rRNA pseudouridine2605 synthase
MEERLQKIIARAGVASRRRAEQFITSGMVTVNGQTVTGLGTKADPARDHIKVRGKLLRFPVEKLYLALNKPDAVVSTMSDPQGRPSLAAYLRGVPGRAFPVGRLDYHAQGLLLLTNDGDWANTLLRGAHSLEQVYWFKLKGRLDSAALREIEARSRTRLRLVRDGENAWYEVRFGSGRESAYQALTAALRETGHPIEKERRVRVGNVELGNLTAGQCRNLLPWEVAGLRRAAEGRPAAQPRARGPRRISRRPGGKLK